MKANDSTQLLKMISGLQNKIDRLERKISPNAVLSGLTSTGATALPANTAVTLTWDESSPIINEGIILQDSTSFTAMASGVYSITLEGFVNPAVADLQLRFVVADTYQGPWTSKKQINCFGFTPRTAFCTTFNVYLNEGNNFYFQMVASAATNLVLRLNKPTQTYPSPILTIAQITDGYDLSSRPNEWYGDDDV